MLIKLKILTNFDLDKEMKMKSWQHKKRKVQFGNFFQRRFRK